MSKPLKIALIGFGNIGTGVVRHLAEYATIINDRLPRPIVLKTICDTDLESGRDVSTEGIELTSDYNSIVNDPEVEVVIELVGGTTIANTIVRAALEAGKHVVTANKALIATYGAELFEIAEKGGAFLLFEASVGAGIPIIRSLQTGLQPNTITSLHGILNGTCNYILSTMEDQPGVEFEAVLKEAMRLGYAEPDPTLDIEGNDTAHKLAILGSLIYETDLRDSDVVLQGITRIRPVDFDHARRTGQTIKLLATAVRDTSGAPGLSVWPTFIPENHPVGRVRGVINTVWVEGDPIGPTMYSGPGAGQGSTSSGVLSDVMLIAQACDRNSLKHLNPLSFRPSGKAGARTGILHPERYLRIICDDPDTIARQVELPLAGRWNDAVALTAPAHSNTERQELLGKLASLGVGDTNVCEIRYALQPDQSIPKD